MHKVKERILEKIKERQKQLTQINSEIVELWEEYYGYNSSREAEDSS